jgi:hypothetical protein
MAWLVDGYQCRTVAEPEGRSQSTVVSVVRWQSQEGRSQSTVVSVVRWQSQEGRSQSRVVSFNQTAARFMPIDPCQLLQLRLYMAAVACSPISDFLSSIVTGLSLWVSFLLHMVAALCSPIGGFLHSDRVVPMGIFPSL